ncbi:MAG: hypothetical protein GY801_36940 [bacterium]|nr:hypothetical protein [bacterium]
MSPRERVKTILRHQEPDRVPVDFLATPEIWHKLIAHLQLENFPVDETDFFEPTREAVLQHFEVDCRVLAYDQFCHPPDSILSEGAEVDWWGAMSRSTPNRMWRQKLPDGTFRNIWGHHIKIAENPTGAYEEFASWSLGDATSVEDLKQYPWPEPDWWDFSALPDVIRQLDEHREYHLRFRIGSVFELAWQLRGMEKFLVELGTAPAIPLYIMDRLTDVHLENTRRVLELAGDRIDMVYFYDDVATQQSLMMSPRMWRKHIRPRHAHIAELARSYGKSVMYHCDGAIYRLIPELIEIGIDLLNPIQADIEEMAPKRLKDEFGDRLCFHGGIDIMHTLPHGTPDDVVAEARERIRVLGRNGGYILAGSHHIQSDTPLNNVLSLYDPSVRTPAARCYSQTEKPIHKAAENTRRNIAVKEEEAT